MEFFESNPRLGDRLMLVDDQGYHIYYREFDWFYEMAHTALRERTVMFLFCENTAGAVFFYLLCLRKGIVPLLLDNNLDEQLLERLIRCYEPEYLAVPSGRAVRQCDGPAVLEGYGYTIYEQENKHGRQIHQELALLLMTSGSTGSPKLVRLSRKNLTSNAESIAKYLEITEKERPVTTLPMNYTYGLSIINSHILKGATILLTRRSLMEAGFWSFFKENQATSFGGVPFTYQMLKRLRFFEMELPSLKTMTQAGGKLPKKLQAEFAEYAFRTGRSFVVMYGQTEATARMGFLPPEDALRKCGSIGKAIPGGRFHLLDDCGMTILRPDVTGELFYEGENVAMGYAMSREDLARGNEWQGLLSTGDLAKYDSEGYYYIVGRKKRFLKMYGKRVGLDEIEQLLRDRYGDIEIACVGEDDHMRIYFTGELDEEEAVDWLAEKTRIYSGGIRMIPADHIPKNGAGKILYKELE